MRYLFPLACLVLLAGCLPDSRPPPSAPLPPAAVAAAPRPVDPAAFCYRCGAPAAGTTMLNGKLIGFCAVHIPYETAPAAAPAARAVPVRQPALTPAASWDLPPRPAYTAPQPDARPALQVQVSRPDLNRCMVCGAPAVATKTYDGQAWAYCAEHLPQSAAAPSLAQGPAVAQPSGMLGAGREAGSGDGSLLGGYGSYGSGYVSTNGRRRPPDGVAKSEPVSGYRRRDGTYVHSYYRRPRR